MVLSLAIKCYCEVAPVVHFVNTIKIKLRLRRSVPPFASYNLLLANEGIEFPERNINVSTDYYPVFKLLGIVLPTDETSCSPKF